MSDRLPYRTVRDAIGDIPDLDVGETDPDDPAHQAKNHPSQVVERISKVPEDGGSRSAIPREYWPNYWEDLSDDDATNVYGRMYWEKPASILTTRCCTPSSGRFVHPEADRAITPREAARLQTFPDEFWLPDSISQAETMIGNSIPPRLVTAVASSVAEIVE